MLNLHYAILGSQPTLTQLNAYAGTYKKAQTAGATADGALDAVATVILDSDAAINALMPNLAAPKTLATKLLANVGITNAAIVDFIAGFLDGTSNGGKPFPLSTAAVVISNYVASYKTGTSAYTAWDADLVAAQKVHSARAVPEPTGQTFTLTDILDTGAAFTGAGGPDSFNAVDVGTADSTLTAGDSMVGGDGLDTLNLSVSGSATTAASVSTNGIETIAITNNSSNAYSLSAALMSGLKTVKVTSGTSDTTIASPTAILDAQIVSSNKNLTITTPATVTVGTADAASVSFNGAATTASVAVTQDGIETVNVTLTGSATGSSTNSTSASVVSSTLKTLNISGTAAGRLSAAFKSDAATETGTFDASKATGAITATINAGVSGKMAITGGAGNDSFTTRDSAGTAALTKDMTIVGGAGTDTLVAAASFSSTATTQAGANVSGFETTNAGGGTVDQKAFPNNVFTGAANAGTYKNLDATFATLTMSTAGTASIDRLTDGTADALTVNMTASTGSSTITAAEEEAITIVGGGTTLGRTHTVSLSAAKATTLTVTGANSVLLGAIADATTLSKIDASGHTGIEFSADGSASTVAMTITGSAGVPTTAGGTVNTLTGGSKADVITGGAYKDVINGGNGDDIITGGAGNDVLSGEVGNDNIDGGDGNDSLSGYSGNDVLAGGAGVDTIDAGSGADTVDGGSGNDLLIITSLTDTDLIDGGADTDTAVADAISSTDSYGVTGAASADYITVAADAAPKITNVETLWMKFTAASANNSATTAETIDLTGITNTKTLNLIVSDDTATSNGRVTVKNWGGSAINLASTTHVNNLTLDGVGQDLTVNLRNYSDLVAVGGGAEAAGDLTFTGVAGLTISARNEYLNSATATVPTQVLNDVGAITAATATSLKVSVPDSTATNAGPLDTGVITATAANAITIEVGQKNAVNIASIAATGEAVSELTVTVADDSTLTLTAGGGSSDINMPLSVLSSGTISVGVGARLIGDDIVASSITKLGITVGAAGTFDMDLDTGGVITLGASSGSVVNVDTLGSAGQNVSFTPSGRMKFNEDPGTVIADITVVGAKATIDLSGIVDQSATTDTFTVNGSALTGALTYVGNKFEKNSVTGGGGNDNISGSDLADTLSGGTGADTISGGSGNDSITSGAGADYMSGGSGTDTFVFALATSVASTANTLGTTIAAGNTVTFGSSVDYISDFGSTDILDITTAATVPTSLLGLTTATALTAGTSYVAYGTWSGSTGVFTIAAGFDALTAKDALVVVDGNSQTAILSTGVVILDDLAAALVTGNIG